MTAPGRSPAVVMFGQPVAEAIEARVAEGVAELTRARGVVPSLAIVLVGESGPSQRYVKRKIEACARLGMRAEVTQLPPTISADALRDEVVRLGRAPEHHGVLVQLPLPPHIETHDSTTTNKFDVFDAIPADKDVDGVGKDAIASLYRAQQERMRLMPGTALAVRRMMAFYGVATAGKLAVVVGRNDITSKPMVQMLGGRLCNAAAIWCHRHVSADDQKRLIQQADIIVTAVGAPSYRITADMVKPGVAVFDVATRVDAAGKMHGDVDFEAVKELASFITPVPKGVGPVTVAALSENLLRAAQFQAGVGKPGYAFA
jgi:methylenetetrahydrofolate dehydrogenase (NADP+) / methenyltetrahydrofolate cyclohydrolase